MNVIVSQPGEAAGLAAGMGSMDLAARFLRLAERVIERRNA